jgi:hypothetical protein
MPGSRVRTAMSRTSKLTDCRASLDGSTRPSMPVNPARHVYTYTADERATARIRDHPSEEFGRTSAGFQSMRSRLAATMLSVSRPW